MLKKHVCKLRYHFFIFSVQTRALGHITDIVTRPLFQIMHERWSSNKFRTQYLQQQISSLEKELQGETLSQEQNDLIQV